MQFASSDEFHDSGLKLITKLWEHLVYGPLSIGGDTSFEIRSTSNLLTFEECSLKVASNLI
jgi:hypothetical protein